MYKTHGELETPPDDTVVWRYMDIEKFFSLVTRKALYFRRIDKLIDEFEGSLPERNLDSWLSKNFWPETIENAIRRGGKCKEGLEEKLKNYPSPAEIFRWWEFVNCWHKNDYESVAMWSLYTKRLGVAIKSTIGAIKKSLEGTKTNINIGIVKYINYNTEKIEKGIELKLIFHKKIQFKHEEEVRLLLKGNPEEPPEKDKTELQKDTIIIPFNIPYKEFKWDNQEFGCYVPVDLNNLIGEIYLSPKAPELLFEICQFLLDIYGLKKQVLKSELDKSPLF